MLSPTDAAWSVLEEGHRVEKFLPLAALPFLAAAGYGGYQGAKNVRENQVTDPVLGVIGAEGDDSFLSNALEFGTGAAQGLGVGAGTKLALGGAGRFAGRGAAKREAARQHAARNAAAEARSKTASQLARDTGGSYRAGLDTSYAQRMGNEAHRAALGKPALRDRFAAAAMAKPAGKATKVGAGAGLTRLATPAALLYGAGQIADALTPTSGPVQGFGAGGGMAPAQSGQQGFSLSGQGSGGVGGVQNVGVGDMADKDIFQGKQFQSAPTSSNMQAPSIKQKGTPMSLGNNLIKSAVANMEFNIMKGTECKRCGKKISKMGCHCMKKADACKRCGKKGCVNKMHCMAKADDDGKKKKPAHGMVIVIGSKAGPGPSTNGKRDDKKDDKE